MCISEKYSYCCNTSTNTAYAKNQRFFIVRYRFILHSFRFQQTIKLQFSNNSKFSCVFWTDAPTSIDLTQWRRSPSTMEHRWNRFRALSCHGYKIFNHLKLCFIIEGDSTRFRLDWQKTIVVTFQLSWENCLRLQPHHHHVDVQFFSFSFIARFILTQLSTSFLL